MTHIWELQEAKNKLDEIVDHSLRDGPQVIAQHGTNIAVVLSYAGYCRIVTSQPNLSAFFRESPLAEAEIDLSRDKSLA